MIQSEKAVIEWFTGLVITGTGIIPTHPDAKQ